MYFQFICCLYFYFDSYVIYVSILLFLFFSIYIIHALIEFEIIELLSIENVQYLYKIMMKYESWKYKWLPFCMQLFEMKQEMNVKLLKVHIMSHENKI